jgi:hypothetical protein
MSDIYQPSTNYRKIWTDAHGPIPKDSDGRTYEIHHIDGDHSNNVLEDLKAVSIQEHYDIHWAQGDWGACKMIARKMKMSPQLISELASLANHEKIAKGIHHFCDSEWQKQTQDKLVAKGTHHLLGGKIQRQSILEGRHPSQHQKTYTCPHCGLIGNGGTMLRWHFDNCKHKST